MQPQDHPLESPDEENKPNKKLRTVPISLTKTTSASIMQMAVDNDIYILEWEKTLNIPFQDTHTLEYRNKFFSLHIYFKLIFYL